MQTFTCALCHRTFDSCVSDAEARAEARRQFGCEPDPDWPVVCDECYRVVLGEAPPIPPPERDPS